MNKTHAIKVNSCMLLSQCTHQSSSRFTRFSSALSVHKMAVTSTAHNTKSNVELDEKRGWFFLFMFYFLLSKTPMMMIVSKAKEEKQSKTGIGTMMTTITKLTSEDR